MKDECREKNEGSHIAVTECTTTGHGLVLAEAIEWLT